MRLGILGWPVGHSLSPRMQAAALAALGLEGWSYEPLAVPPEGLATALAALRAPPWRGANVTLPHKPAAAALMDALAGAAGAIGAVNTIVVEGGRLIGHNTDAAGFLDAVGEVRGLRAAVLGAGGSARAVVHALRGGGAAEIRCLARRPVLLPEADRALAWEAGSLAGCDLVVGCVPPDAAPPPLDALAPGARVLDLTYYGRSGLLLAARARGLSAEDGREVLVRQGARSFQLWTGRDAPLEIMRQAVARESSG